MYLKLPEPVVVFTMPEEAKFVNKVYEFKDGIKYIGQQDSEGNLHGFGILVNGDGNIFEYYWVKGKSEGRGRTVGDGVFEYECKQGDCNGFAKEEFKS